MRKYLKLFKSKDLNLMIEKRGLSFPALKSYGMLMHSCSDEIFEINEEVYNKLKYESVIDDLVQKLVGEKVFQKWSRENIFLQLMNLNSNSIRFGAIQNSQEFIRFLIYVSNSKPRNILEIGRGAGGALFGLTQIMQDDGIIVSIDYPGYGEEFNDKLCKYFNRDNGSKKFKLNSENFEKKIIYSFKKPTQKMFFVDGISQSKKTLDKVKSIIKDNKFDLIFIDGDHSYDGVSSDYYLYNSLLSENGSIAFHDVLVRDNDQNHFGVSRFWNEVSKEKNFILIDDSSKTAMPLGIGILSNI